MTLPNSPTHQILRVIGSPFASSNLKINIDDISTLYRYATRNRMPLLYLEALNRLSKLGPLGGEYDKLRDRYINTVQAVSRVSRVLEKAGVNYAFFKSIRPYQEVTVDLDILIFGTMFQKVMRIMRGASYIFLGSGPFSATFRDAGTGVDADIHNEIGASHIVYLDKNKLRKFITHSKLPNGDIVYSLDSGADLLAVIAHSVVKEQLYVLSEYYITLYYLANMSGEALNSFLSLVQEFRMLSATKAHLGITALLHKEAHGLIPVCLIRLLNELGLNSLEFLRVKKMRLHMPHKYHMITVAKALVENLKENKAKSSLPPQALTILNPKFTSSVLKKLLDHATRETY